MKLLRQDRSRVLEDQLPNPAPMAQVPACAVGAVVRVHPAIGAMASACGADRFAAADEHRLRRATAFQGRQVPIDEVSVDVEAHDLIVASDRDSFRVAISASDSEICCGDEGPGRSYSRQVRAEQSG